MGNKEIVKLPAWYKPIDPVLQEFLKQYHATLKRRMYTTCIPFCFDRPYQSNFGKCTLLKRTMNSKLKYSTGTTVTFVNFSKFELTLTISSIATTMNGCGFGIMGNNVTIDMTKSEPKEQTIVLKPVLYQENLVERVRDDARILKHFSHNSINSESNKMFLIIPSSLSASSALIDPCSHSYYLTVNVTDGLREMKPLMVNILHRANCDVIFNNEHVDTDFNGQIMTHMIHLIDQKRSELNDNAEELAYLETQKKMYIDRLHKQS